MKPWEFEIKGPLDLPVYADLLADWGHPGEKVVRWMIEEKIWPACHLAGYYFWYITPTEVISKAHFYVSEAHGLRSGGNHLNCQQAIEYLVNQWRTFKP